MALHRTSAAIAASALLALATGCGGSGGGNAPKPVPAKGTKVSIAGFKFVPPKITVPVGTKLVFSNDDTASHTATADDRSFDTGSIRRGKRATVTLRRAGTFSYICQFHPFMKGSVTVEQ
jgi:plastocyanin